LKIFMIEGGYPLDDQIAMSSNGALCRTFEAIGRAGL